MTLPVMKFLQAEGNDIQDGMHQIETLKSLCSKLRAEVGAFHQKCYFEALELADRVDVSESMPQTSRKQRNRANPPSVSPSDYFKKVVTIPLLDYLNGQLSTRFDYSSLLPYKALVMIPSRMLP